MAMSGVDPPEKHIFRNFKIVHDHPLGHRLVGEICQIRAEMRVLGPFVLRGVVFGSTLEKFGKKRVKMGGPGKVFGSQLQKISCSKSHSEKVFFLFETRVFFILLRQNFFFGP